MRARRMSAGAEGTSTTPSMSGTAPVMKLGFVGIPTFSKVESGHAELCHLLGKLQQEDAAWGILAERETPAGAYTTP